jgi:hypothetical protein
MHPVRIDLVLAGTKFEPQEVTSPTGEHCTTFKEPSKMAKGAEAGHEVGAGLVCMHPRRPDVLDSTGME